MTQTDNSTSESQRISLAVRMLTGGTIGFLVISFFVFGVDYTDPAWGKYWRIRPLIITPLAGAMGGLCNYIIMKFRHVVGVKKTGAAIASVLVFLVGLWMGIILGLDGTLWD